MFQCIQEQKIECRYNRSENASIMYRECNLLFFWMMSPLFCVRGHRSLLCISGSNSVLVFAKVIDSRVDFHNDRLW